MTNSFINQTKRIPNRKTENYADAYSSTGSNLLDLFASIGSLRSRAAKDIYSKFSKAYKEDRLLATKMAFYARNIRGGLGERAVFKDILKWLAFNDPEVLKINMFCVPIFGRWDDLFALVGTPVEEDMWDLITIQFITDIDNYNNHKPFSLLAKWMKSINTSSKESRKLGRITCKKLGLKPQEYRRILSILRRQLEVVERKMSNQEWEKIDFNKVPSLAMTRYHKAFYKHVPENFRTYMEDVKEGKAKLHADTLYPYNILEQLNLSYSWGWMRSDEEEFFKCDYNEFLELQWIALPNYIERKNNILVMADTSGSMSGRPIHTSIGLAIYFAERNHGDFRNCFLTFSHKPSFIHLPEFGTLQSKINKIPSIVENTNLEAAFDLVLKTGIIGKVPAEDMPKAIIVISDGEIDHFSTDNTCWSFFQSMEKKFNSYGYEIPKIIMWNVDSRHDIYLDRMENPKIQFISGQSPSVFKYILNSINKSAYELMLEVLNDPIYNVITIEK